MHNQLHQHVSSSYLPPLVDIISLYMNLFMREKQFKVSAITLCKRDHRGHENAGVTVTFACLKMPSQAHRHLELRVLCAN